jgi:hypothetical protein
VTPALHTALAALSGLECWSVIAGSGTGSVVSLGFGARVPARRFSGNQNLSLEERQFEPEFLLYVEAAWRLEDEHGVLVTWSEAASGAAWLDQLEKLRGRDVKTAEVRSAGLDLEVRFEGGFTYSVFCDQGPEDDNYSILTPRHVVAVGPRSHVVVEKRD